ncbi:MAG TPA: DUF480 domain-containing protein [Acidimicrobiales bacterium]|jgi:uncharacterized protein YceH (UPF0502 family)|nr:DUF480 domain-containing protein [Acidimicrobiales bacterium]
MQIGVEQARVVGSLIEKRLTTPQQYPLTLNALVLACNQTSNRAPVVDYGESVVESALSQLRDQRLVRFVLPSHGRSVVRYRQVLDEVLGIDDRQLALLAVLLLRGPQTVGELRTRTERMVDFDDLGSVEHDLELMASLGGGLVERLPRRPGQKEERWAQLLADHEGSTGQAMSGPPGEDDEDPFLAAGPAPPPSGSLAELRDEVTALRSEIEGLRSELIELRASLGG